MVVGQPKVIAVMVAGVVAVVVALAILRVGVLDSTGSLGGKSRKVHASVPISTDAPRDKIAGADTRTTRSNPRPPDHKLSGNWYEAFRDSDDYVRTVRTAVEAAETGDDAAAWELSVLMLKCATTVRSIRSGETKDEFLADTRLPGYPPGAASLIQQAYDRCASLAVAPEFADWDFRTGKLGQKYWRDLALTLGNPSVKAEAVVSSAFRLSNLDPERREQLVPRIRADVKDILRSRDGEAWYKLGLGLNSAYFAKDLALSWAIALASCDLGYDCRVTNERNAWYGCASEGKCSEDMDLNDMLQVTHPALHAKAYAKYQELTELMKRGEWDKIEKYAPLDGLLFQQGGAPPPDD